MDSFPVRNVRDKELRYVTLDEYNQLISYIEESNVFKKDRTTLLFKLLWNTGGRITEVISIKKKDVDLRNKIITLEVLKKNAIFKYMSINLSKKEIYKYKMLNYIQLTPDQNEILDTGGSINLTPVQIKTWRSKIPPVKNQIPISVQLANEIELFCFKHQLNDNDKLIKLSRTQAWKIVSDLTEKVLGKKFHPHSFRHGFAMNLLNKNVPAPIIQSLLKHSSLNTTFNTYAVPTLEMKRKALEDR
jgi:integrase